MTIYKSQCSLCRNIQSIIEILAPADRHVIPRQVKVGSPVIAVANIHIIKATLIRKVADQLLRRQR